MNPYVKLKHVPACQNSESASSQICIQAVIKKEFHKGWNRSDFRIISFFAFLLILRKFIYIKILSFQIDIEGVSALF